MTETPVRERIIRAAVELFGSVGYARTTTAQIVAAAGITKPMLYYYFGDKRGLFLAVLGQAKERVAAGLERIRAVGLGPSARLAAIADDMFEIARESPTLMRLQFAAYYGLSGDVPRAELEEPGVLTFFALVDAALAGVASGELRGAPGEIAMAVHGIANLYVMAYLARPAETPLPTGQQVVDMLLAGIGRR